MSKKIIFGLLVVVILGIISFFYFRGEMFSKEILKLEILGPDNAKMGDEVEYTVTYKNNGNFVLQNPKLIFELPDNSLTEDSKLRLTQDLKDIYPGAEDSVKFKARLLGKENDLKKVHAWLSYTPKNLSARYESDTTFITKIDTVPITLNFDLPSKAERGKDLTFSLNYFSNIDYPMENLSVKIDSISGFTIRSSDPSSLDNLEWKLNTLNKGQGGRINIKGVMTPDTVDVVSFSAKLGMWLNGNFIVIKEFSQDVSMIKPLIFVSQQINGSSNYIASPGEVLRYEIFLRNIGSTPFSNLFVLSRLNGSAFDFSTLQSSDGQVSTNDNLVVWDPKQVFQLKIVNSQQEVKISFTVKLRETWVTTDAEKNNVILKNKVTFASIDQEFITMVNSKLELSQMAYYTTQNGIENSGPMPPKVGEVTTYAITWQIKNYFNDLKNIKVKAVLPQSVSLSDAIFPEDQASHFSFDNASREIVWLVGNIPSGSLTSLTFQVALTPNSWQKGTLANLIGQAYIVGEDQSTGAMTQSSAYPVNTSLPDDKSNTGKGIVQ